MAIDTQKEQDAIEEQTALPGFKDDNEKQPDMTDIVRDITEKIEARREEINRMWPDLDEYAEQLSDRDAFIEVAKSLKPKSILDTFTEEESEQIIQALDMAAEIEKSAQALSGDAREARLAEAYCFAHHFLCPRPLIHAVQESGIRFTVEVLGNLTGCYQQCLDGMREIPGVHVPAELNRKIKSQFSDCIEEFIDLQKYLSRNDHLSIADFGTYMDGYEE